MEPAAVPRAWDSDLHVVRRIACPAFRLPPPELIGAERMPADVRRACDWAWARPEFPAYDIIVRHYRWVLVSEQGLIFRRRDKSVYVASISQHSEADIHRNLLQVQEAERRDAVIKVHGPSVLCAKPGGDNYGHWLNEMLPRAHLARDLGIDGLKYLVPAAEPALAAVIRDSLAMIGVPESAIVPLAGPTWTEELYGVNGFTAHGVFMSPRTFDCLEEIAARLPPDGPRKIYVTRQGRSRKFAAEAGVGDAFRRKGFQVVDPARLSFRAQVQAFKGAREVAGCMGAGLTNIAFAREGARVTAFAPAEMADTFYWFLAGFRKQPYREVRCEVAPEPQGRGRRDHDLLIDPAEAVALAQRRTASLSLPRLA